MAELSTDYFPDGVLNVFPGPGSEVGTPLVKHDRVRKVSFTGSTNVGKQVMRNAADEVTPVTLELGGKSPIIVFPDADLDKVLDAVANGIFYATGEICDAFSRVLVHEDVLGEFTDKFVEKANVYDIGVSLNESTTLAQLTSQSQYDKVQKYIEVGKAEATLLTGGERPADESIAEGWFIVPTVFGDVANGMRIAQKEIIGPVETIISLSTYGEAIDLANDVSYGLAAGIGTERNDLVHATSADIDAGLVYVNEYGPIIPEAPYGGFKHSGIERTSAQKRLTTTPEPNPST